MSPEQVRGEKLDARTDLFSFGLVLYEMTAGQRAFMGETAPILHAAILNHTPTPVRYLNPQIPARLEGIINKALEKDREGRYQSASEIRADLESMSVSSSRQTDMRSGKLARYSRWPLVFSGVLVLLLAAGVTWLSNRHASTLPDLKQRQLTANSSENAVTGAAISPDGKYLAYADLKGIHVTLIETGETKTVPQPESLKGTQVNWWIQSGWADGGASLIANARPHGERPSIWTIPVTGGAPRKLRDDAAAWTVSRDGSWLAFGTNLGKLFYRQMWVMRPDGGQARSSTKPTRTALSAAPNGRRMVNDWLTSRSTSQSGARVNGTSKAGT
jgi:eukaryotic-like serine/threonine-protein kinase